MKTLTIICLLTLLSACNNSEDQAKEKLKAQQEGLAKSHVTDVPKIGKAKIIDWSSVSEKAGSSK